MIYLDHHAASPVSSSAEEAMRRAREAGWANPSSVHAAGRKARALLEDARRQVADAMGSEPADIVFTAGGTEACNLGILGLTEAGSSGHVVTTSVEHPAVEASMQRLEAQGARVDRLAVPEGLAPDPEELRRAIQTDTALVAVQWVNHETGTVFPVEAYAEVCRAAGVPLFVDATQAFGKIAIDASRLGATALAVASHKIGGPAGSGALYVKRTSQLAPQTLGGAQERGRRGGTPDVVAATGFGAAASEVSARIEALKRLVPWREYLETELRALGGDINAGNYPRVPTVSNASFRGHRGDWLVAALDVAGVCVSSGSACSSGLNEPSKILRAMYPDDDARAASALRLSFGPETEERHLHEAIAALSTIIRRKTST